MTTTHQPNPPRSDVPDHTSADAATHEPSASPGDAPARPRRWRRRLAWAIGTTLGVSASVMLLSCVYIPRANPAFDLSHAQARDEIADMRENPVPLTRPVVVVSGWRSPSTNADGLVSQIREATEAEASEVAAWSAPLADDITEAAADLIRFVEGRWPSKDGSATTTEVDVVAISMGGLVSRTAARGRAIDDSTTNELPRLAIRNLYSFASPHDGARLSDLIRVDTASAQMRPGSSFMAELNAAYAEADYELTPYAVLHDRWVGATRAAPPGEEPIWVSGRVVLSHHLMTYDRRLVADLLRRLRDEQPYGEPSAPPRD